MEYGLGFWGAYAMFHISLFVRPCGLLLRKNVSERWRFIEIKMHFGFEKRRSLGRLDSSFVFIVRPDVLKHVSPLIETFLHGISGPRP